MRGGEGYRQKFHSSLFGSTPGLVIIAALAGRHDIIPGIGAAEADRGDMIPGQVSILKPVTAIEANMGIALEQGSIVQWRGISFSGLEQRPGISSRGDDGIDLNDAALAR